MLSVLEGRVGGRAKSLSHLNLGVAIMFTPQIETPLLVQLAVARLGNSIRHEKTLLVIKRQGLKT
jgi:hypothetical protein